MWFVDLKVEFVYIFRLALELGFSPMVPLAAVVIFQVVATLGRLWLPLPML